MKYAKARFAVTAITMMLMVFSTGGATADAGREEKEIAILPGWKDGDSRAYERIKTRRRLRDGKETGRGSARTPVRVAIGEANEDGYLVRWSYGETKSDDPGADKDPVVGAMNRIVDGMKVELELDRDAMIQGVRNWEELKTAAGSIVDVLVGKQRDQGMDQPTLDKTRATLASMFATRAQVEGLFTREPQLFFVPIGRAYLPGRPIEYEDRLPNPVGGEPFPCRGKFELKSYDRATGRAVVGWTQVVDPEVARRVMAEAIRKMGERLGKKPPDAEDLESLIVEDHAEFVLDARTGWIERFSHTRTTKTGRVSQEDIITMQRIEKN